MCINSYIDFYKYLLLLYMEKQMATHSSILSWKIPWTEEPGGPQCMGSQRVRHDLVTKPPQLIYSVVMVSGGQQMDSAMHMLLLLSCFSHVRFCATPWTAAHQAPLSWNSLGKNTGVGCHFLLLSHTYLYPKLSSHPGCHTEQNSTCWTVYPCQLSILSIAVCTCRSQTLYLLPPFFPIYKGCHMIFLLVSLRYFTEHDNFQVHLCCCKWHYFILFNVL